MLATHGNTRLGGDDLDQRLVDFLADKLRQAGGPALDTQTASGLPLPNSGSPPPAPARPIPEIRVLRSRLREAAEHAKIRLSTELEIEIALPFLTPEFSFHYRLTRAELEQLTRDLIERTRAHCLRSLADAKLEAPDLHQVILVGGQTRMPLVRRRVAEWFGCAPIGADFGGLDGARPATERAAC